jgi:hypothetical protein
MDLLLRMKVPPAATVEIHQCMACVDGYGQEKWEYHLKRCGVCDEDDRNLLMSIMAADYDKF